MLIENNESASDKVGGGVVLYSGTMLMVRCIVRSNTAYYGGGLMVYNGEATLLGNTFEQNTATESGGGDDIHNLNGAVTVHGCRDGATKGAALGTYGTIGGEPFNWRVDSNLISPEGKIPLCLRKNPEIGKRI
ncbi:hypothetical protein ScalyP_jg9949 [Parmales sp. scaly parma]|nr:hypothetical protein ScalyP_jg9949 [Parmales sp. scaly parma]